MVQRRKWILFFEKTIWRIKPEDVSRTRFLGYGILKRLILTIRIFINQRLYYRASALTYSTLFATIPILAIVFAIANGFGFEKLIEQEIHKNFSSQTDTANAIIGFVKSYLAHTQNSFFIGFGLILLFWTLISLTSSIEQTFNQIWQVKHPRSAFRQITDYTAVFLLLPVFFVVTSGLSVFFSTFVQELPDFLLLGSFMKFCIKLIPFILIGVLFTGLYLFMPNTRVSLKSAAIPGFVAGAAFQFVQYFYIHSQLWMSSYNAIYGSFAALPLFMMWCQISWYICLFGAEWSYVDQNIEHFFDGKDTPGISRRYHDFLCILIMSLICKRYQTSIGPYSAQEIALRHELPIRLVNDILYELCDIGFLYEKTNDEKGDVSVFLPARDIAQLTIGRLLAAIEKKGNEDSKDNLYPKFRQKWDTYNKLRNEWLSLHKLNTPLSEL